MLSSECKCVLPAGAENDRAFRCPANTIDGRGRPCAHWTPALKVVVLDVVT
jgi:hypothetical protein